MVLPDDLNNKKPKTVLEIIEQPSKKSRCSGDNSDSEVRNILECVWYMTPLQSDSHNYIRSLQVVTVRRRNKDTKLKQNWRKRRSKDYRERRD